MSLSKEKIFELGNKAREIRKSIISMLFEAGSGHTAGALGMADIFSYLYFTGLKHDPKNPSWSERDYLILSNGHICPVLYATLAHAGYFSTEELKTLRKFGSKLQGHPHREFLHILENSSGPLGSGLSQALGMALALKMDKKENKVVVLLGDGELNEGQNWEAFMMAGKNKTENLIAFIDRNHIQIDGFTEDVMPLEPLTQKFESFNWHVETIDGHNFEEINRAFIEAKERKDKPTVIIAKTVPSKGVPPFENKYEWHGKAPNREEMEMALKALEK